MTLQEIVAPDVDIPVLYRIIKTCGNIHILVELPGMDGTCHWRNGVAVFQRKGITDILVVADGILCPILHRPPSVGTPE